MDIHQPILLAVPLDETMGNLIEAGASIAQALHAQIVPVHAMSRMTAKSKYGEEAAREREQIDTWLQILVKQGLEVAEPVIEAGDAALLVLRLADLTGAQMIVAGNGRGRTIQQWLLGSTVDRLVRTARVPVFLARGTMPGPGKPIVCPVDGSAHARTGLFAALRMARLFNAPLLLVTAVETVHSALIRTEELTRKAEEMEAEAKAEAEVLLASVDTTGVQVKLEVRAGPPGNVIIEASRDAFLLVIASRSFDHLVPMSTGNVTEQVVRSARCSVLTVLDTNIDRDDRERALQHVAQLRAKATACTARGDHAGAVQALEGATALVPTHTGLELELADALEKAGRPSDAALHRQYAATIRERLG